MTEYVFTLTAGRTGTAWLAELFAANFDCVAQHEYLNFGEFGVRTQDVGLMSTFNHWGNGKRIQNFWHRKFGLIPETPMYVETNHALAKCGLIENLTMLPDDAAITIVTLRRDWLPQAVSYLKRHDFANLSTVWLWYLDSRYQNVIVSPKPFAGMGTHGYVLWYIAEVEARQAYYRLLFGERYRFIETRLEEMTTHAGAQRLLRHFGHTGPIDLPGRANANDPNYAPVDEARMKALIERVTFDPDAVARTYIDSGRRLHIRAEPATT